ncbi:MAG: HepT-like ribonuclease domain-containing protein [Anaerolineae bacterium]
MLDHAREAMLLSRGRTRADLDADRLLNLSLVRLLEVVGEAATRIPYEVQAAHPEIPWPQIIGLRNRLIHGYGSIDFDIVWRIVTEDLPQLVAALEKIIEEQE